MSTLRKTGLAILVLQGLFVGAWALVEPGSWYADFPGLGRSWVSPTGPYNEHFATDIGATYLALAAAALLALAWNDSRACQLAGAVWAVFSAPHFLFHVRHLDGLGSIDKVGQLGSLGATLVLAVALAWPARSRVNDSR